MQRVGIMTDEKFSSSNLNTNIQFDSNFEAFLYSVLKVQEKFDPVKRQQFLDLILYRTVLFFWQTLTWAI